MAVERRTSYHPNLHVERDGHVATVTIDRPESKNGCTINTRYVERRSPVFTGR